MTDLVERLLSPTTYACIQPTWMHKPDYSKGKALLKEAATAIEAKDKELAELRERVKELECDPQSSELPTWPELANYWKASAETAERERDEVIEDAALIVERWSLPTMQTQSMWLIDKAGIASDIRALRAARAITGEKP